MPDYDIRPSRVTHGAVHVLAYLHGTDASCSEVARQTSLSESSTYRWLTELADIGILEADAIRSDTGRAVIEYRLEDDELGAAAQVVADRLYRDGSVAPDGAECMSKANPGFDLLQQVLWRAPIGDRRRATTGTSSWVSTDSTIISNYSEI